MHDLSKKTCQKLHARKRARQRYHIRLTKEEYDEIVAMIKQVRLGFVSRYCFKVEHQTEKIYVYAVYKFRKWMPVVYDSGRKTIVTFLPNQYFKDQSVMLPSMNEPKQ